jgi:thiol-disulfide isomerase/thioredoxin
VKIAVEAVGTRWRLNAETTRLASAPHRSPLVSLAQFKGQPTVVNLWATWCPPCVREMPVLQQAQIDNPDVNFVFVNQRESVDKVDAWLQARRLTMRNMLLDKDGQAAAAFKQRALPMTLFFNQKGRLVSARIGELSSATLTERLAALRPSLPRNATTGAVQAISAVRTASWLWNDLPPHE